MAGHFNRILVIQTAFIGDAILTLPLIQKLKQSTQSLIDVVVVPKTAEIFSNHPAITGIITYDKHGKESGPLKFWKLRNRLKEKKYDLIIVPHRSLRSALLARLLKPNMSIGFDRSAGSWLFTDVVKYDPALHEIERDLSLLAPLGLPAGQSELPHLYPAKEDKQAVDSILSELKIEGNARMVALAPGSVWNTKKWPKERFASVCREISSEGHTICLVGGKEDLDLCEEVAAASQARNIFNFAGKFSLLQSAELISRCKVLVSNDSAPMHLAVAVGTPVVAIFGATVPEFGFAPRGPRDIIIETKGLKCRPCAIHGGKKCPIKTFVCMIAITPETVVEKVKRIID